MNEAAAIRRLSWNTHRRSVLAMIGLIGVFVLLPVQLFQLPHNMDLVDVWMVGVLFVFLCGFVSGYQTLRVNTFYLIAMWVILFASAASTFAAVDRTTSLVVVLKEVYLFATFVAVTAILFRLSARDFRLVMMVWMWTAVLHGMLILAEFLQPSVFHFASGLAGQSADCDFFRPSGLFFSPKAGNANKAAVFQLLGFVPLVVARPSRAIALMGGGVLFSSILATGSMGTTIAFTAGVIVAIGALAVFSRHLLLIVSLLTRTVAAVAVLATVMFVVIGNNPGYQEHFERIIVGRAEKSSSGRFSLWKRGIVALNEPAILLWGVGPENFRDVDVLDKQLHNDVLAFAVERGVFGVLGLLMLAGVVLVRSVYLLKLGCQNAKDFELAPVVFLAAFAAVLVVSLTHQVIHSREIWLVIAAQEATIFRYEHSLATTLNANSLMQIRQCWGAT